MTVGEWLKQASGRLERSLSPDPVPDAEWMLEWALEKKRNGVLLAKKEGLSPEIYRQLEEVLRRRENGEPLQYCLREAWFYGRKFISDERALIPRQDTEILCEAALCYVHRHSQVLDMCTGSGILALTAALEAPGSTVYAADISEKALSLAEENARALGANVLFRQGDLFEAVKGLSFDVIMCNPPYLTKTDMDELQREVRYEPENALLGGEDGLVFYRRIAADAPKHLNKGGMLLMEIGSTQAGDVCGLLGAFRAVKVLKDLQGMDRVVIGYY